jgi:Kef-type K+ transport system membrane component KefB
MAYFAEYLGVSAAIGAFLLGIGMQRNKYLMSDTLETFTKIGEGSFIPLFFFSVGSSFTISEFNPIYIIIIPLVIISKSLGSFTGAMFSTNPFRNFIYRMRKRLEKLETEKIHEEIKEKKGFSHWWNLRKPDIISSSRIAVGMIPKGEITLVIAAIGLNGGAFAGDIYSIVILLVLTTVFLTPILLRLAFRQSKKKKNEQLNIEE